ncbi:protease inhibitor I42 family protein [Polyangium sp. y55x31]|uniref:protease inhibitor I42 family protein n=1 Tax=Polyangium sp. y55x31 TaxID=3042688 RepID=UPI0024831F87|nr:protease inhibitor I42 family protein [Polyangium sp. y55x31]MDI1475968.1 protease inhibitor I42 family protein [Polyangium sp. y55x31]
MKKIWSSSVVLALVSVLVGLWPARAQAREIVVTNADNGHEVTLRRGDTLIVRVESNPTTGSSWYTVLAPGSIVKVSRHLYNARPCPGGAVGCGGVEEFRFTPTTNTTVQVAEWLRMLYLRPFEAGIEGATLWQVHVNLVP